jgi:hypothetical protein
MIDESGAEVSGDPASVLYPLYHVHVYGDGREDCKFIGIFSSSPKVDEAISAAILLPGFEDAREGFWALPVQVDREVVEGRHVFYVVRQRESLEAGDLFDSSDVVGIFFDEKEAEFVKRDRERLEVGGGEYYLMDVMINERQWREGYITVNPETMDEF